MDLQQPIPPNYSSGGQNPYDFIVNGAPKQKRSFLPSPSNPKEKKLFLIAGIGIVIAVLALLVMLLGGGGGGVSAALTPIAQKQTEIIRITTLGSQKARSTTTVTFAENALYTTTSAQKSTLAYMSKYGKAPPSKTLALGMNAQTDTKLKSAELAGQYDEVFSAILKSELQSYQQAVSTQYKATNSKSEKVLLQNLYTQATLVLKSAQ